MKSYEPAMREVTLCDYCGCKILNYHDYIHIGETDYHINCYGLTKKTTKQELKENN